jgi:RNA polymerase sigma-70 factor (ECF subfamily)
MMDEKFIPKALVLLYPKLKRFAVTLTGSLDRADDLVQRTCEWVLRHPPQALPGTRLECWLYGLMRLAWVDQQREDLRTRALLDADDLPSADGSSQAENWLMLDEVYREIIQLPEEQRTVLILVSIDGLSYREVAEILEVPVGTVMNRLARARLALANRIKAPHPIPTTS